MRILLAIHHFPPRYTAGAEGQALRLAQSLIERGHEVRVVSIEQVNRGAADGALVWEDTAHLGIPVRRLAFDLSRVPDPSGFEFRNLWIRDHLLTWLPELRPGLIHLFSGYLMTGAVLEAAEQLGVPRLVTAVDYWFLCRRITLLRSDGQVSALPIRPENCVQCLAEERRRFRWLGRIAPGLMHRYYAGQARGIARFADRAVYLRARLNAADLVIANSVFLRQVYLEFGVQPERITFMRQGLDLAAYGSVDPGPPSPGGLRVGYFGQIAPLKGIHVLVAAARQVQDPRLQVRIYGDVKRFPKYAAQLKTQIGSDPRIIFAGSYHGAVEQARAFRDLDVLVIPSVWYENSPNVILEAYANGKPVIAADWGGMAELIEPGRGGLKYPPGDSAALAQILQRLLVEPELLVQLRRGIPGVKSLVEEVDETEAHYLRLLSSRRSSDKA